MIEIREPRPGEIEAIGRNAAEPWVREISQNSDKLVALLASQWTRVGTIDGEPAAAGGFVDHGNGVAMSWALVGRIPKHAFVHLCRSYRAYLNRAPFHWIEAQCVDNFEQAFRWVRLLGFVPIEGARCFAPDGREFKRFLFQRTPHGR